MKFFLPPLFCLFLSGASPLFASAAEVQIHALAKDSLRLESYETAHFQWKESDAEAEEKPPVYLSFDARIDAGKFASGGAPALRIRVNKAPVTVDLLVNKQTQWIHGKRSFNSWGGANETLTLLYHRWGDETPALGRLHRYVFDISNLLDAGHRAEVEFASTYAAIEGAFVEVKNVQVQVGGAVERHPHPVVEEPLYLSRPLLSYRKKAIALHRGVGLQLDTSADYKVGQKVSLSTESTLPATPVAARLEASGAIQLGEAKFPVAIDLHVGQAAGGWASLARAEGGWSIETPPEEEGDTLRTTYKNATLRLERRVIRTAFGTEVFDKVTNLTSSDAPVGMLYTVGLGSVDLLQEFRLFGRKRASFYSNSVPTRESATVPTAYFKNREGVALGILVEDDVLRNQASYLAWDDTFAFGTDLFYLPPHASHEFHFSTSSAGDYFTFLNKTREKWNTFQEIPGLFGFLYPFKQDKRLNNPAKLAEFLDDTGITIPCIVPSVDYASKAPKMLYGNERPASIKKAAEGLAAFAQTLHEAKPGMPLSVYTDVHLVRTDGDASMLEELSDSVVHDYRGSPVEYREGWLYNLLPTENTSAGARFRENLTTYLDTPGVKGVFLDEWDHSRALFSFRHPDGHTAQVGEAFRIERKIGSVPLLIRDYQKSISDLLQSRKVVVYANQFDSTRIATALPMVHFAEPTQLDSYFLYGAQLGRTPLSLTVKRSTKPWDDVQEFLKKGVLTCFYARRLTGDHLLRHLYPFTARRLGPGYVVGKERIVTLVDGSYTFGDKRPIQAKIFGGEKGHFIRILRAEASGDAPSMLSLTLDREQNEVAIVEIEPQLSKE